MTTRAQFVREALEWLGTPKVWGQSTKGVGCDCLGLAIGIGRELGMPEIDFDRLEVQNYRTADSERLLANVSARLRPVPLEQRRPGDVLLLPVYGDPAPRHVGIVVSETEMVHCYGRAVGRVAKVNIGANRPIHSCWTWPSFGD